MGLGLEWEIHNVYTLHILDIALWCHQIWREITRNAMEV